MVRCFMLLDSLIIEPGKSKRYKQCLKLNDKIISGLAPTFQPCKGT